MRSTSLGGSGVPPSSGRVPGRPFGQVTTPSMTVHRAIFVQGLASPVSLHKKASLMLTNSSVYNLSRSLTDLVRVTYFSAPLKKSKEQKLPCPPLSESCFPEKCQPLIEASHSHQLLPELLIRSASSTYASLEKALDPPACSLALACRSRAPGPKSWFYWVG